MMLVSVKVNKMILGGVHGKISPDPTGLVLDFSMRRTFQVTYAWINSPVSWDVYVYNADKSLSTTATVFPHANRAFVSGDMQNGTTPVVEYRQQGNSAWNTVPADKMQIGTASYQAEITSLLPGTDYECQVTAGGVSSGV